MHEAVGTNIGQKGREGRFGASLGRLAFGVVAAGAVVQAALCKYRQAQSGAIHNGIPGYAAQTDSHASINPLLLILLPLQ